MQSYERSYHIFYELLASEKIASEWKHLKLTDSSQFACTSNGRAVAASAIDDAAMFYGVQVL